jgi:hypothetical protein
MISCVVLVVLGTNRSNDEETSLKLFSGADPINLPCFGSCLFRRGRSLCGAAKIGFGPHLTSPNLLFLGNFSKSPQKIEGNYKIEPQKRVFIQLASGHGQADALVRIVIQIGTIPWKFSKKPSN